MVKALLMLLAMAAGLPALAGPPGCPWDGTSDDRVDIEDLYHLSQNPADINGDGVADGEDLRCLEAYLRCAEVRDMTIGAGRPAGDGMVAALKLREVTRPASTVTDPTGTVQTLEVVRRPSPDGAGCSGESWTVQLLGSSPSLAGAVRLEARLDGFAWMPVFLGQDISTLSVGAVSGVPAGALCEGSSIALAASWEGLTVVSNDHLRALVLIDGQDVVAKAVQKGVVDAAARGIGGGLIDSYIHGSGVVTLARPGREMLVLFELDGVDPADPAFAYDDLALRVDLGCGNLDSSEPRTVVLRDSIGGDSSTTDGNFTFTATRSGGVWTHIPIKISATESVNVSSIRGVLAAVSENFAFHEFDYNIRVWDSLTALNASPSLGNVLNVTLDEPTAGPTEFGTAQSSFGSVLVQVSFVAIFDISEHDIMIPAGQTYYIAVEFRSISGTGQSGILGWVESTEAGETDWYYWSDGAPGTINSVPISTRSGRIGFEILANAP